MNNNTEGNFLKVRSKMILLGYIQFKLVDKFGLTLE